MRTLTHQHGLVGQGLHLELASTACVMSVSLKMFSLQKTILQKRNMLIGRSPRFKIPYKVHWCDQS